MPRQFMIRTSKVTMSAGALSFAVFVTVSGAAMAAPHEITLATPEVAKNACSKMGQWDIALIIGKGGLSQFGPGYGCKQEVPTNTGVGNAIDANGVECTLATPEEAKTICSSMGDWDIAGVIGRDGFSQFGPKYGCKQEVPKDTGIGNAICK